jgi:hypothetical protein
MRTVNHLTSISSAASLEAATTRLIEHLLLLIDHLLVVVFHRLLVIFLGDGGLLVEHKEEEQRDQADQGEECVNHCPAEDGKDQVGYQETYEGGQGCPNEEKRVDLGAESRVIKYIVDLLCSIDVAGYSWEDGEVPSLHREAATNPDLVQDLRLRAILMHGQCEKCQKEEDDSINSLEPNDVLNCSPNESETCSAEEA